MHAVKCRACGIDGKPSRPFIVGKDDPLDRAIEMMQENEEEEVATILFAEDETYLTFLCFPCKAKVENICIQCWELVDTLYRDLRCKTGTYVCDECLKNESTNHIWKCYSNGCMTAEEVAQEAFENLSEDVDFYD